MLNGLAVCHMKNDRHEEAHSLLLESLEKVCNIHRLTSMMCLLDHSPSSSILADAVE